MDGNTKHALDSLLLAYADDYFNKTDRIKLLAEQTLFIYGLFYRALNLNIEISRVQSKMFNIDWERFKAFFKAQHLKVIFYEV